MESVNPIESLANDFRKRYGSFGIEEATDDIKIRYYLFGLFSQHMPALMSRDFATFEKIFSAAQRIVELESQID